MTRQEKVEKIFTRIEELETPKENREVGMLSNTIAVLNGILFETTGREELLIEEETFTDTTLDEVFEFLK